METHWVDCAPLNRPRFAPSVCAVPNGLAVLGGFSGGGDGGERGSRATLDDEAYDARSNTDERAQFGVLRPRGRRPDGGDRRRRFCPGGALRVWCRGAGSSAGAATKSCAAPRSPATTTNLSTLPRAPSRGPTRRTCCSRDSKPESPARDGRFDRFRRRGDVVACHDTCLRRRTRRLVAADSSGTPPATALSALRLPATASSAPRRAGDWPRDDGDRVLGPRDGRVAPCWGLDGALDFPDAGSFRARCAL